MIQLSRKIMAMLEYIGYACMVVILMFQCLLLTIGYVCVFSMVKELERRAYAKVLKQFQQQQKQQLEDKETKEKQKEEEESRDVVDR